MNQKVPEPISVIVGVSWVLDKVWCSVSYTFSDGKNVNAQTQSFEWPVQPTTATEWRDVVDYAVEHCMVPTPLLEV